MGRSMAAVLVSLSLAATACAQTNESPVDASGAATPASALAAASGANTSVSRITSPLATGGERVEVVFGGFDEIEFPFAGVADSAAELESFGLAVPDGIDWPTRAVVVFAIPTDLCPPVLADLEVIDGVAEPVFVNPGYDECPQPLLSRTIVASVDRQFLAEAQTLRLPKDPPYFKKNLDADITISPATKAEEPASRPEPSFEKVQGPLPLPGQGEALSHQLQDGTPLMIVHHHDGTISALDPRANAPTGADGFTKRFVLVTWNAKTRNFISAGVWDEYGRRNDGPRDTDLSGYATRIQDGSLEIGDPIDPPTGAPIAVTSDPPAAADVRPATGDPVSLEEALTKPVGSVVYLGAQVVFIGTDARLCIDDGTPIFEAQACPDGSPIADGVIGDEGFLQIWHAPVLATRTTDGFTDIVPQGGNSSLRR